MYSIETVGKLKKTPSARNPQLPVGRRENAEERESERSPSLQAPNLLAVDIAHRRLVTK